VEKKFILIVVLLLTGIIGLVGLHRTGMFINPVGQVLGSACGNNICELEETKCSCPEDCGLCEVYTGTCKRNYCSGDDCKTEIIEDCCGNQLCELGECGSCKYDCSGKDCGLFSVDLDEIVNGKKTDNYIRFDVASKDTSSYLTFSINAYDEDVNSLEVEYDCCIENKETCNPLNVTRMIFGHFFNPKQATLDENADEVLILNSRGSLKYVFGFYFFDKSFIPRTYEGDLITGKYWARCDLFFQSSGPEYSIIKSYDILFNVE